MEEVAVMAYNIRSLAVKDLRKSTKVRSEPCPAPDFSQILQILAEFMLGVLELSHPVAN
jgi:hypothetical protein